MASKTSAGDFADGLGLTQIVLPARLLRASQKRLLTPFWSQSAGRVGDRRIVLKWARRSWAVVVCGGQGRRSRIREDRSANSPFSIFCARSRRTSH